MMKKLLLARQEPHVEVAAPAAPAGAADLTAAIRSIGQQASTIGREAAEAGRGFGVVADAVKDLAAKVESSSKEIMRTIGVLDARVDALAKEIRYDEGAQKQGAFHSALADVRRGVGDISGAAQQSRTI